MLNTIKINYFNSPVGEIIIGVYDKKVCLCDWRYRKQRAKIDKRITTYLKTEYIESKTDLHDLVIEQLKQYFNKDRTSFSIPIVLIGTDFQKSVWNLLINIPYGATNSYKQLSQKLENEGAVRAIAAANGANSISIIVPCHRVIGADGSLVGYAGGIKAKRELLHIEGFEIDKEQLSLF